MKHIRAQLEVLDQQEIEAIHAASARLLAGTGARVPHAPTLALCRQLGCEVDGEVLHIPADVLESFAERCRRSGLDKAGKSSPDGPGCRVMNRLTGNISTQVYRVDYQKQVRRYGLLADILEGIALIGHLKNIPRANAVVIPHDVPPAISDVISCARIYTYSAKPGGTYVLTPASARYILAMAKLVNQPVEYLFETISPLAFRPESLQIAWQFREAGQPVGIAPMVNAGSTAPVSLAGALVQQNAEVLLSLFLVEVLTGRIADYITGGHTTDMRSMLCSFGSPNQALLGIGTAQMARFYGLPSGSNSGLTDAWLPDFQGGFEKAFSALLACAAGTSYIGCQGIAGADQGFSFEQLVIDNEWLAACNYALAGLAVSADSLGLEVIERVGIGGGFLAEEHTVAWLADSYFPSDLFSRLPWQDNSADTLLARAHKKVLLYTAHLPDPVLPPSLVDALDYLVRQAASELVRP